MASSPTELTPQERLAISRKAIVRHMNRHHPREIEDRDDDEAGETDEPPAAPGNSLLDKVRYGVRMWWHRHPASAVVELATPLLGDYARAHPFKLLGASAAVGAAAVLLRPWRMVSASALLVAAVKSSGLTNTLITMISSATRHAGNTGPTR